MKNFKEIIPPAILLDEELNAVRGGASDKIAECGGGKSGDIECNMGKITISDKQELTACS